MKRFLPVSRHRLALCEQRAEQAQDQLRIYQTMFTHAQPVMVTDARAHIQQANAALCELMGYSLQEMLGKTPKMFRSDHHDQAFYTQMVQTIQATGHWEGEVWDRRKSGDVFPKWMSITAVPDAHGQVTHMVACYTDLSGQQHAREQIHQLAFYDILTGLPNRALLRERLQQAQERATRRGHYSALLLLDWDDFKALNDGQGYPAGDSFLKLLGQRLQTCLPHSNKGDTVARLGGDEFALVVHNLGHNTEQAASQAEALAEHIAHTLAQPCTVGPLPYQGTVSIGLVLFNDSAHDADSLLKQAEIAMYQAKEQGRGRHHFFDPALEQSVTQRLQLEAALRTGIVQDALVLHYQPQVRLRTDAAGQRQFEVSGAEALVRWQHPERGLLGPGLFIPLAEETGLILALGRWVLRNACQQLGAWRQQPALAHLTLAVNVSASQFMQPGFVQEVTQLLAQTGAAPQQLKLELTESLLVTQPEQVIATMEQLRSQGVLFSLDDFGTGYSSLSYLKHLPLYQLKIDQSFVRNMEADQSDSTIAKSIAALAHGLGLNVIAEGVETPGQQRLLHSMGCAHYQGYWFSKPLPLAEFEHWCRNGLANFNTI